MLIPVSMLRAWVPSTPPSNHLQHQPGPEAGPGRSTTLPLTSGTKKVLEFNYTGLIDPSNLDSSLCFFQPHVSHDVLCIQAKQAG